MTAPTLLTERLRLTAPDASCDDAYLRFYTDAQASAFYNGPLAPAAVWSRLLHDAGAWSVQGFGVWAVRRREDDAVLGVCGFWQGRGWPCELTWWLLPEARGQGLALEASRAVVAHALAPVPQGFGWDAVRTYTKDTNEAARALVRRLGGRVVDRLPFPDGETRDLWEIARAA